MINWVDKWVSKDVEDLENIISKEDLIVGFVLINSESYFVVEKMFFYLELWNICKSGIMLDSKEGFLEFLRL